MKKYKYEIVINKKVDKNISNEMEYQFGNTKGIVLKIQENAAIISMELSTKKTEEQFVSFNVKQFRDAFRKISLIHVLYYGKNLKVKKICINIDGEKHTFTKDNKNFPFMFSMISMCNVNYLNTYDWELVKEIVNKPKTIQDDDKKYACLYSFLCSLGREYYIDRFTNLWTSVNAFYNSLAEKFHEAMDGDNRLSDTKLKEKLSFIRKDEKGVDAAASIFGGGEIVNKIKTEKTELEIIHYMSDYFRKWSEQGYEKMLESVKNNNIKDERIVELNEYAENMGCNAYAWILFRFPYIVRCNLLHGNRVSPVISAYNDPEILILEALCYVISDFLNDNIRWLFEQKELNDEEYDILLRFAANYVGKNQREISKSGFELMKNIGYIKETETYKIGE